MIENLRVTGRVLCTGQQSTVSFLNSVNTFTSQPATEQANTHPPPPPLNKLELLKSVKLPRHSHWECLSSFHKSLTPPPLYALRGHTGRVVCKFRYNLIYAESLTIRDCIWVVVTCTVFLVITVICAYIIHLLVKIWSPWLCMEFFIGFGAKLP